jgi:hypothetical protein
MLKVHAPHPTQHAACGSHAHHQVHVVSEDAFRAAPVDRKCGRCAKVIAALDAGRPVYAGYEDPDTGERGARRLK